MAEEAAVEVPEAVKFTLKEQKQRSKDGELTAWGCTSCDYKSFTPMYRCTKCKSRDLKIVRLPDTGVIESFTVQKISNEEFINEIPFAFAVIRMDDGTLVSGWVPDISRDEDLPIGAKVRHEGTYKPGYMFEKA